MMSSVVLSCIPYNSNAYMPDLLDHSTRSNGPDFPAGPAFKPRIDLPTADRLMSALSSAVFQFYNLQYVHQSGELPNRWLQSSNLIFHREKRLGETYGA
jgi:hypothetical protein